MYYSLSALNLDADVAWLCPIGFLLDLVEAHFQFEGNRKPKRELTIDDVIPV
jgi:hypothetical protein